MPAMTREELAERRKRIADAVKSGKSISDVSKQYRVGVSTVKNACVEHNVEIPRRQSGTPAARPADDFLQILAWLIEGYTGAKIAEDMGCTQQYVSLVHRRASAMGIFDAIRSLGKEIPENQDPKKLSDEKKFAILKFVLEGKLTYEEIGKKTGTHKATISDIVQVAKKSGLMKFAENDRTRNR